MTPAIQTIWAELIVGTLADAGVTTCVVSPGSRSTPLVAALAADGRLETPTLIDERAAAFFALGAARATGSAVAMLCTSGSAAAHYLPAIIEASESAVSLIAITADRPPELQHCGAAQTIDQVKLYGGFVRAAFDLGAPVGSELALRAVRRTVLQAIARARGPHPGPIHLEVPLRKPLEPSPPQTDDDRALRELSARLRREPVVTTVPLLTADPAALSELEDSIAAEPRGLVVAGAMPPMFNGDSVVALAERAGYPILAEAASGLRQRGSDAVFVDHFDLVLSSRPHTGAPDPKLVIQLGADPVSAGWASRNLPEAKRWMLCDHTWRDPDRSARGVVVGDIAATCRALCERLSARGSSLRANQSAADFVAQWRSVSDRTVAAAERSLTAHPTSEAAILRGALAALPDGTTVQIGNSLPIRVVDQVWQTAARGNHIVIAQRGAAGIDGMIASASGATYRRAPVLLIVGDVSFSHDVGGLIAARHAKAPLAILVIDNGGGRIFDGMPISRAVDRAAFDRYFATAPGIDPAAVASALGVRAVGKVTAETVTSTVASALTMPGPTVIHAPVSAAGAHDFRRTALELLEGPTHV